MHFIISEPRFHLPLTEMDLRFTDVLLQGWKLALAHSPMRVSSPSGEWKSQVTRPVWRVEFSSSGKLNCN